MIKSAMDDKEMCIAERMVIGMKVDAKGLANKVGIIPIQQTQMEWMRLTITWSRTRAIQTLMW